MRIYWVIFGMFSIHAAIVNSMYVPGTDVFESLRRTKRADEKQEHEQTSVDSAVATKSTKHENDHSVKHETVHPSIVTQSKSSTPSKPHETLTTTTLSTPLSTTAVTTTTPEPTTSTHVPIQIKPTHESKVSVNTVEQHSKMPQSPYQLVPHAAVDQHFGPIHNPEQFAPPQNSFAYRESSIPHGRTAYKDYDLGSIYQAAPIYHQVAPSYHQSSPVTYAQPMVYSQQPEYQPPCGSSVLISCQPSVQQSPCSSYQPSYHVDAPSYHFEVPSYQPQPLPNSSYREAEQNGMLVQEPLVGRHQHHGHHHHHHHHHNGQYYDDRYGQYYNDNNGQYYNDNYRKFYDNNYTITQKPKKLDSIETVKEMQTTGNDPMNETEENVTDVVKHLMDVKKKPDVAVKDDNGSNDTETVDDTNVGVPLMTAMPIDKSTTEEPTKQMRQMQSAEISKQDSMQTNQMPFSMMQSGQQMPPQIPPDQMPSSVMQRNQQAEPSQIPSNQMPSSMMQSGQQMLPQISSDQMPSSVIHRDQQAEPSQIPSNQMPSSMMQSGQQMLPQFSSEQMQPNQNQFVPQQMMNNPMNPLTLDPMLINPVNMRPVHEFHQSSFDGPMLGMQNPMMEDPATQSAGGSPQQMFWEPTGLYYRIIQ